MDRVGGDIMDEKQAKLSHFAGIIRIFVGLIIVFILVFSFTRWASRRRVANEAAQKAAVTTSQTAKKTTGETKNDTKNADKSASKASDTSKQLAEVPSGIDDSIRQPSGASGSVPSAGIESSVGLTGLMITVVAYLFVYTSGQKHSLLK